MKNAQFCLMIVQVSFSVFRRDWWAFYRGLTVSNGVHISQTHSFISVLTLCERASLGKIYTQHIFPLSIISRHEYGTLPHGKKIKDRAVAYRHQMETFSALLALCEGNPPVTGGFPPQRPVTRSFDVFFDLNKRLSKQSRCRWFETQSPSL